MVKKKAAEKKEDSNVNPMIWKVLIALFLGFVLFSFYWGYNNILKDKELVAKCQEVQEQLKGSPSFRQCACSPTPEDAFDPDYAEAYNKTTRGCTCNCVLVDGSKKSFEIRYSK